MSRTADLALCADAVQVVDELAEGKRRAQRRRRVLLVIARRGLDGVDCACDDVRDAVQFAAELAIERAPKRLHPESLRCRVCDGTGTRFLPDGPCADVMERECHRCDGTGRDPGDEERKVWRRNEIESIAASVVAAAQLAVKGART